jgi:hypothetical protein
MRRIGSVFVVLVGGEIEILLRDPSGHPDDRADSTVQIEYFKVALA